LFCTVFLGGCASAVSQPATPTADSPSSTTKPDNTGLYMTPAKAYQMWRAIPDRVQILDVRTTGEYIFVGHAPMARNIPYQNLTGQWDARASKVVMEPNPDFLPAVRRAYRPEDTILVMCRSGRRGMAAVAAMQTAGFRKALNIDGGFEGEAGKPCDCPSSVQLIKPGWKTLRQPWTYDLDPNLMYLTEKPKQAGTAPAGGSEGR